MDPYEPLATGTLLVVEGRRADPATLSDPDALDALLRGLARDLQAGDGSHGTRLDAPDGTSHVLALDEAYLILHAFPELRAYAFKAFSRHALTDVELFRRALHVLRSGRVESTLRRQAAGLPAGADALLRRLQGERAWARARTYDPPAQAPA